MNATTLLTATASLLGSQAQVDVRADRVLHSLTRTMTGACIEDVNHEIYGGIYSQMIFGESFQEPPKEGGVSGMWRAVQTGTAHGEFSMDETAPFVGLRSQRLEFVDGAGVVGIENKGLNRQGMHFSARKPYEGALWVRADAQVDLVVRLESADGSSILAEKSVPVKGGCWEKLGFTLTPSASADGARFVVALNKRGAVTLGYAFLQPGPWGRFKDLPDRRDVVEGLIAQGVTVLRYGGSMVNHPEYRWKKMIGPRDWRSPYTGTWYAHSTNGWGIVDFLDLCVAAGFEAIPAFNMGESAQDMADFVEYVNGPESSKWGRKRAEDGHPKPYGLHHIELGNEERVDEAYFRKFKPLAEAIWAKDPNMVVVVGDFGYSEPIHDPFSFGGAWAGITSLSAQRDILRLAKDHGTEVWFDVHVNTEGPRPDSSLAGAQSFENALERIADGAQFHVAVFELNAGNHSQRRALANAIALNALERSGRFPVVTSANCLQVDGQNDNDWNQGLLFLNPSQVWLQPPGYITQMYARNHESLVVDCRVTPPGGALDVCATKSEDGKTLVLKVVNPSDAAVAAEVRVAGFKPSGAFAGVTELAAPLDATNTAFQPRTVVPQTRKWRHGLAKGAAEAGFAPHSITVLRFEGASVSEAPWDFFGEFARRAEVQPVIQPDANSVFDCPMRGRPVHWEAKHTFNPAAVVKDGKVWVLYRAEDDSGSGIGGYTSRLGLASSDDGVHFVKHTAPVLYPADDGQRALEWEGGCEDPRCIETEDGRFVLFYTQYRRTADGYSTDVGIAVSRDLVHWTKEGPIRASGAKGATVVPPKSASMVTAVKNGRLVAVKIDGRYWLYCGVGTIELFTSPDLKTWTAVSGFKFEPRPGRFDSGLVECGPPAVLTPDGIVLLYNAMNAVGAEGDTALSADLYTCGWVSFDAKDPARQIARSDEPFFKPELSWEKTGQYTAGTTFIEGLVFFKGKWFLYYGCADKFVGVAVATPN